MIKKQLRKKTADKSVVRPFFHDIHFSPVNAVHCAEVEVVGAISGVDVLFLEDSNGLVAGLDTVCGSGIAWRWGSVGSPGPVGKLRTVGDSHQGQDSNDELKHKFRR